MTGALMLGVGKPSTCPLCHLTDGVRCFTGDSDGSCETVSLGELAFNPVDLFSNAG